MSMGIGETLRTARLRRGHTLADVAEETRIRQSYLGALEDERFQALGGDVYVKGFLRSYARFLELDPEPLLDTYRRNHAQTDVRTPAALSSRSVASASRPRGAGAAVVGGAAAVLLALLAGVGYLGGGASGDDETVFAPGPEPVDEGEDEGDRPEADDRGDDADDAEPQSPAPTPEETADAADQPTPDPVQPPATEDDAGGPDQDDEADGDEDAEQGDEPEDAGERPQEGVEVELTVSGGESWMRVVADGERVFEGILAEGASETFQADNEISLRLGNAGAVSLVVNGEEHGVAGGSGEVLTVSFDADGDPA